MDEREMHTRIIAALMERLGITHLEFSPEYMKELAKKDVFFSFDTGTKNISVMVSK